MMNSGTTDTSTGEGHDVEVWVIQPLWTGVGCVVPPIRLSGVTGLTVLSKVKMMKWTTDDVTLLKKNYLDWTVSIDEIAEMLGRTRASVRAKARSLGMRRPIPTDITLEGREGFLP